MDPTSCQRFRRRKEDEQAAKKTHAGLVSVTVDTTSPVNLSTRIPARSDFDEYSVKPEYINQEGQVNITPVDRSIEQEPQRLGTLLQNETTQVPLDTKVPPPLGDAIKEIKEQLKNHLEAAEVVPRL